MVLEEAKETLKVIREYLLADRLLKINRTARINYGLAS
jgi:hypothetical protein